MLFEGGVRVTGVLRGPGVGNNDLDFEVLPSQAVCLNNNSNSSNTTQVPARTYNSTIQKITTQSPVYTKDNSGVSNTVSLFVSVFVYSHSHSCTVLVQ